jgi:GMP synthase (glutamine-hydrolysing)
MPSGPEYGTVELLRTEAGTRDPLLGTMPERFLAQAAHFQAVLAPPSGSVVLAEGAAGIQALRFGPMAWGVQFHPEFTTDVMRLIIEAIAGALAAEGVDVAARIAELRASPEAAGVVAGFGRLAAACRR